VGGNNPLIVSSGRAVSELQVTAEALPNVALAFHEALHGFTNLSDHQIEIDLTGSVNQYSDVIDTYRILVAILLMSLSGDICQAQASSGTVEIRVPALDYKTGRPLKRHRITIWLSDSAGEIRYHVSQEISRSTGEDGRAFFQLTEPLPLNIRVDTDMLPDWNCAATWQLPTGIILQRGVVGEYTSDAECKKKGLPPAAPAVPGEVVIFVHQLGVFGRLHRLFY
jgi:hypothetical protein